MNIISNAIKFSRVSESSFIHITSCIEKGGNEIAGKVMPDNYYCHITISDNGIGFDQKYSELIFKVFQRLNAREEYDGTGIGLSIVKKIVDNHNGFIIPSGEVNKGATFEIFIPHPEDPVPVENSAKNNGFAHNYKA